MTRFQRLLPVFVLLCAAGLGLIYVFLVPVWMHYDEPNHFEFAYLAAKWNRIPQPGEYDPEMRLAVARSELESGFIEVLNLPVLDLENPKQPVWIGPESQLYDQPLYYLWAGLPLRLFSDRSIETQLYLTRMMSWILYLVTVWVIYLAACELSPNGHALRLSMMAAAAFLPPFVDYMTSVNNNVAEILLVSVVILSIIRLLVRGLSWQSLGLGLLALVLAYWVKTTGLLIAPFFLMALWFSVFKAERRWIAWVGLFGTIITIILFSLQWNDAIYWYRASSQSEPVRKESAKAVSGQYIFQVDMASPSFPSWNSSFYQALPRQDRMFSTSIEYTVGAWIWADSPMQIYLPRLTAAKMNYVHVASIDEIPQFYAYTATLPLGELIFPFHLDLRPKMGQTGRGMVYYDDIILVQGHYPIDKAPVFSDLELTTGSWGGRGFTNLIRNGSAEAAGPRIREFVDLNLARFLPNQVLPSLTLMSAFDREGAWWFYYQSVVTLFYTFWGKFGWGAITLLGAKPFRIFWVVTFLASFATLLIGVREIRRQKSTYPWELVFVLGVILTAYFGFALVRGISFLGTNKLFYAPARYAFPAMIPTMLFFSTGVSCFIESLQNRKVWARTGWYIVLIISFLLVNYWAIISIKTFMEV